VAVDLETRQRIKRAVDDANKWLKSKFYRVDLNDAIKFYEENHPDAKQRKDEGNERKARIRSGRADDSIPTDLDWGSADDE